MPTQGGRTSSGISENNRSSLRLRIISAAALAPIVLLTVYFGDLAFYLMIAVALLLMAYEWCRLTCSEAWGWDMLLAAMAGLGAISFVQFPALADDLPVTPLVTAFGVIGLGLAGAAVRALWKRQDLLWRVCSVPYIAVGAVALVWLRQHEPAGLILVLWALVIVWSMDIGAYFFGRAIGGPRLAPRISPNKTWAGMIGGMFCAGLAGGTLACTAGFGTAAKLILLSALIGGWSQMGDLAESAVKRYFGVKDMSNLIPGHGGILDRVDGLLFGAPAVLLLALVLFE